MADAPFSIDAYSPAEVARRVEAVGVTKATMPLYRTGALSVLAGAFIALGGVFFLTVTTDMKAGYGPGQLLGGLVFALGLVLVGLVYWACYLWDGHPSAKPSPREAMNK